MAARKFISDTVLNIISSFFPIFVLQIIVYPIISREISENSYGLMLSMYSLISLVSGTLGGELCNSRLLKDKVYEDKNLQGDFNLILLYYLILLPIIAIVGMYILSKQILVVDILLTCYIFFSALIANYLDVGFRLRLDYKAVLISKLILSLGYAIGIILTFITLKWQFVFIVGDTLTIIFLILKTPIIKEGYKKTKLFKSTLKDVMYLNGAGFLQRITTYADKIVLYPLAGGGAVSIYYTATLFGKIISMGINPLTTVILSYLAKSENTKRKLMNQFLLISAGVCIIGYFICVGISSPVLEILFPQWKEEAMKLVPMATIGVCLSAYASILTPFILKFCKMHWQVIVNGISVVIFLICGYILLQNFGLMGFCIGMNISYVVKLFLLLYLYFKSLNKLNKAEELMIKK